LDVIWLCRPCHGRAHWAERRRLSPTSTNEFEVAAAQQLLPTYLRLPRWLDDLTREEAERLGVKRHELLIRIIQEAMITH
jgi:hypothetical protein